MRTDLTDRSDHRDTRPRRFMVVWQDPEARTFHHVGRLEFTAAGEFCFADVPGARLAPRFRPFAAFPDLEHEYRSNELFPFFANRVMSARRPDFDAHLTALGLTREDWTPLELLARSAGERATDTIQVIPGHRGALRGRTRSRERRVSRFRQLREGQELHLRPDPSNPEDHRAVLIDGTAARSRASLWSVRTGLRCRGTCTSSAASWSSPDSDRRRIVVERPSSCEPHGPERWTAR